MNNPLSLWLRTATAEERAWLAHECGTSVSYLYQLCGAKHNRRRPNVVLAVALEAATRRAQAVKQGLPVVTCGDLAELFKL